MSVLARSIVPWGALLVAACGDGALETEAPMIAGISIETSFVVTLSPGEARQLAVVARRSDGNPVDVGVAPTWRSADPNRATVAADGTVRAEGPLGQVWLFADALGFTDSVSVWVQKPESEPSTFEITLVFAEHVPDRWRVALTRAARRWEQVIRAPLPAVDIEPLEDHCGPDSRRAMQRGIERGVRISVTTSGDFPPGTYVEAVGGPCMHRGLPHPTTALGKIVLNEDKFDESINPFRLGFVAHHEMGHTFGLAGIVQGFQPDWLDPLPGIYTGHLPLFGHFKETGRTVSSFSFANGSHWNVPDVMGATGSPERISFVSVGSLMDFGYPAAWYGAGEWDVPQGR